MKTTMRQIGIWLAALLLAALLGIMVSQGTGANGPVIWKDYCPRWHDVQLVPEPGGGTNVVCVFSDRAEEVKTR